jgi:hypothetical protein
MLLLVILRINVKYHLDLKMKYQYEKIKVCPFMAQKNSQKACLSWMITLHDRQYGGDGIALAIIGALH